jgi:hypothetical protein
MSIYLVIESYTRVQQSLISVGVVMWVNKQGDNIAPHGGTTPGKVRFILLRKVICQSNMQIDLEEALAPHHNIISKSAILPKLHDITLSSHRHANEIVFSVLTNVS